MKQYWNMISNKVDDLALRERVLIFSAAAFLVFTVVNTFFLDPLRAEQKKVADRASQQQEKLKEIYAQIEGLLQAKQNDAVSPQRQRLSQLRQQIAESNAYLQSSRERLVRPEKMAGLLEQVLNKNGQLQLVNLQTLPVTPLLESAGEGGADPEVAPDNVPERQVFKHGVQITVRGSYPELLRYLTALERMPVQMFWGNVKMNVVQYPVSELSLTIYTLSLDKIWLTV